MSLAYLNGEFLPLAEAKISPLDRGFLFGDGVYEVIPVYAGKFFRFNEHIERLQRSLKACQLNSTLSSQQWHDVLRNIVESNGSGDQSVYLQVTRGAAELRQHTFPETDIPTTQFATSWPLVVKPLAERAKGVSAITLNDNRWELCHIKSVNLLANVLGAQQAKNGGHAEALLIRDGYVIEGTSSNVFIVKDSVLYTPPKTENMLGGITREVVLEICEKQSLNVEIKPITRVELQTADEIWLCSSTKEVLPVVQLDAEAVGTGQAGPVWATIIKEYQTFIQNFSQ